MCRLARHEGPCVRCSTSPAAATADYYLPLNGVPGFHFEWMLNTIVKMTVNETRKKAILLHSFNFEWNCAGEAIRFFFSQNRLTIFFLVRNIHQAWTLICVRQPRNSKYAEKNSTWKWTTSFCSFHSIIERIHFQKQRPKNSKKDRNMQFNRKIPLRAYVPIPLTDWIQIQIWKLKWIKRESEREEAGVGREKLAAYARILFDQTKQINLYICAQTEWR